MSAYHHVKTSQLDIAYLEWNPAGARTAVLLHGWPDSPECWNSVADKLAASGYRVLCPALRGFGPTRFLRADTPAAANWPHWDATCWTSARRWAWSAPCWSATTARAPRATPAAWTPTRPRTWCCYRSATAPTAGPTRAAVPGTQLLVPLVHGHAQGAATVRDSRREFTRYMWDTWSPAGWYEEADFDEAARAFDNPDWAEVVLHSYRQRWGHAQGDPAYAEDAARLTPAPVLAVPTLVLHGGADACNSPATSEGKDAYFSGRYQRRVLDGIGHFPQREAPQAVAQAILRFCEPA